jgi:cytosine/adenosine deaminase-related metal-dependent hydrolase
VFDQLISLGLSGSLAPHAPYSTSLELIELISNFNLDRKIPSSIHNQEREEENKYFLGQASKLTALYSYLGISLDFFKAPKKRSLAHFLPSIFNQQTILVHNTFTNKEDLELSKNSNVSFCFCPTANLYIEDKLPDYSIFNSLASNICVGTDSLASNNSLSVLKEANTILTNSSFTLEEVLQFITHNGAKALSLNSHFGKIAIGRLAGLNNILFEKNQLRLLKKII